MPGLIVERVDALSSMQLRQVERIYEDGFSPELRVPFSELTRTGDRDQTFVAMRGSDPAGFCALRLLSSVHWSFLRYFAIAADRRGQGLGREFWHSLRQALSMAGCPVSVIFEVEDPADAVNDPAERVIRERRIRFWTGCGAQVLPVPGYVLPDYTGSGMTEPMLLMAAREGPLPVSDEARKLVLAIYTDRYGLSSDDPLVVAALASVDRGR